MNKLESDILNLYGKDQYDFQINRYNSLGRAFEEKYGKYSCFLSSSGRIELCGNHTDHNHGKALASAIDLDTVGAVKAEKGSLVRIDSIGYEPVCVDIGDLSKKEEEKGTSVALTKGVLKYLSDKGYSIGAFSAMTESRVFKGAGVSSSASFEILIGKIISVLFNDDKIPACELIFAAHYAENKYFGKPCGLLDQTAIGMGGISYIDFKNPQNPVVETIISDFDDVKIILVNTGGDHANLTEDYADIRGEMEQIASHFGKSYLREVKREEFLSEISELAKKYSGRAVMRAEHFYRENQRVDSAKTALLSGDKTEFLNVVNKSGDSSYKLLQNCYVEGDRAQRIPLALCVAGMQDGVLAKRVHGGGFAGTVILFVSKDKADKVKGNMSAIFGDENVFCLNIRKFGAIRLG